MRSLLTALCGLVLATCAPVLAAEYSGTWHIERAQSDPQLAQLTVEYHRQDRNGNQSWEESRSVSSSELRGITLADLDRDQRKSFEIVRDAGILRADGSFGGGQGAGVWTFESNPSFAAQLQRRGIGAPNGEQQFELTMSDFSLSTLDALLASGFERPSIDDLTAMAQHGVSDRYINEMRGLGIHPKSAAALIRMRDQGISSRYASAMLKVMPGAGIDDLIWLRNQGITDRYLTALKQAGYSGDPHEAVALRNHGVSESYIGELTQIGYHPSAADLIRLRDHGVTASFIRRMRDHGYSKLSVDDLIRLRDSGF